MRHTRMTPQLFELVAARFKAFGEPVRLRILHALGDGERTVSELVRETDIAQANLSRHLQQLLSLGFVARRKRGLFAYYRLADREVLRLCELMCGRLEKEAASRTAALKSA
jgi:DNA-binding transcriptional ArsR family regulator